mmetsp:Transcript_21904/g.62178  ORF Transcript_21904/g.62178 Transcript_21904/m.62178 type:complete len:98 (-) Transcript_21904:447-740(-)
MRGNWDSILQNRDQGSWRVCCFVGNPLAGLARSTATSSRCLKNAQPWHMPQVFADSLAECRCSGYHCSTNAVTHAITDCRGRDGGHRNVTAACWKGD